ncbi:hypothetical protein [Polymorphospora rubra]|uniref:hypothetical protein n=1 Tax=Polymorphospora rubra TaxID=338584 RepID=UPI001BB3ECC5|nr:hypothetical protein [Polymorphospora rubra]
MIDNSGITQCSLRTWRLTRSLFGDFQQAFCSFDGGWHRFLAESSVDDSDAIAGQWDQPGLVLRDQHGGELWLSGCASGYTGEGAAGAGYILRCEGFKPHQIDLISLCGRLHLRKSQSDPVVAEIRRESRKGRGTVSAEPKWSAHIESLVASGYFRDVDSNGL